MACGTAAWIQLPLWELAEMDFPGHLRDQCLAAYLFIYLFIDFQHRPCQLHGHLMETVCFGLFSNAIAGFKFDCTDAPGAFVKIVW